MNGMDDPFVLVQSAFFVEQRLVEFVSEDVRAETELVADVGVGLEPVQFLNGVEDHCSFELFEQTVNLLGVFVCEHDEYHFEDASESVGFDEENAVTTCIQNISESA